LCGAGLSEKANTDRRGKRGVGCENGPSIFKERGGKGRGRRGLFDKKKRGLTIRCLTVKAGKEKEFDVRKKKKTK